LGFRYDLAGMASPLTGDTTATMAILGLLAEQPDTVAGVARRLNERLPQGRFAHNAAHNNMDTLARGGDIRMVKPGAKRTLDRYEATGEGVARFRKWLHESSTVLPAVRDAVRAKIELCGEEDLPALIQAISEEEEVCAVEAGAAHARLLAARQAEGLRPSSPGDWRAKVQDPLRLDEMVLWGFRAKRLERLRGGLEELCEEFNDSGSS
jgi:DNA-binding PadR family transcriptional regulator